MKKTFNNPEMEVLRFQKGADVLLDSNVPGIGTEPAGPEKSLSRGKHDDIDDDDF